jgi:hypothetical protein
VETQRLAAILHPDKTLQLLQSFAASTDCVPVDATLVGSLEDLPPALRRHVGAGPEQQYVWLAWGTFMGIRLVTASLAFELSRERGEPVLEVHQFDEEGRRESVGRWLRTRAGTWAPCAW